MENRDVVISYEDYFKLVDNNEKLQKNNKELKTKLDAWHTVVSSIPALEIRRGYLYFESSELNRGIQYKHDDLVGPSITITVLDKVLEEERKILREEWYKKY